MFRGSPRWPRFTRRIAQPLAGLPLPSAGRPIKVPHNAPRLRLVHQIETCVGPCFDTSESTLFLAVQHPGEDNATHRSGDEEVQAYTLRDRNGGSFEQLWQVPRIMRPPAVLNRPAEPSLLPGGWSW